MSTRTTRRIAINGFGRIGRCIVRAMFERGITDIEVVALNDLTNAETLAHLYNYDTVHGTAAHRATAREGQLVINGKAIRVVAEKDPAKLPWKERQVDVVLECTGVFTDQDRASA